MPCTGSKRALGKASWRGLRCEALLVGGLEVGAPADRLHGLCLLPSLCLPEGPRGLPLSQAPEHSPSLASLHGDFLDSQTSRGQLGLCSPARISPWEPRPRAHYGRLLSLGGVRAQPSCPAVKQMFE